MNYRHIYHAGNFADVAKHVALLYCLEALCRKDSPFFVLDTHAGRGLYDLQAPEAAKSGEAERGIQRLIVNALGAEPLKRYFAAIRARRGKRLPRYPGSPALIAQCLRPHGRCSWSCCRRKRAPSIANSSRPGASPRRSTMGMPCSRRSCRLPSAAAWC
jgi:23S rRNA (adenine2030-N6)-methyltransferase